MSIPEVIYLYRITHVDNLDFILNAGKLTCPNHPNCDPDYIGIGDSTLIESRSSREIDVSPHGSFTDYVSFYFGKRSPMLYNIQNGYKGVTKRDPENIIYLVTKFEWVEQNGSQYVFSDGHGYHKMSQFINDKSGLKEVDWSAVNRKTWADTEDDPDRKRRKQAEFLVYQEVPLSLIGSIIVYNNTVEALISAKLAERNLTCPVLIKPEWYY